MAQGKPRIKPTGRNVWQIDPVQQITQPGKGYDREKEKRNAKRQQAEQVETLDTKIT
jgi:hypothetical protein